MGKMLVSAFCVLALASNAYATILPFSTGFEASEGYTNSSQLATNANWTGDGQDSTGWAISNSTIGGSGAAAGTQWVLASGATASTTKFQWTVTPVTDFSVLPAITGSADVKLVSPTSGTVNRSMVAGIQMYDSEVNQICSLALVMDTQNNYGLGAGQMLIALSFGDETGWIYNLGVANTMNDYVNLKLTANIVTGTVQGFVDGVALPDTGSTGGATDFHDFDLYYGRLLSTSSGTSSRAGFDNYSVMQDVPEPATLVLLALGGFALLRRRS
jgi:hypothetical protein